MMRSDRGSRIPIELLAGLLTAMLASWVLVATWDVQTKYKLAILAAVGGSAALAVFPERRVACVMLWILIHPLSVEKVFFVNAAEGPRFSDPTIAFNVSNFPLVLLALFLVAESLSTGRSAFRWSRITTILLTLLIWSFLSFAIHATYLGDGFTTSAPLELLTELRLLIFTLLVQSAIRSRGDVILILLTVGIAVAIQAGIVGLSYSTGHLFNYAETTSAANAVNTSLQGFDTSGGGEILRATGTVGQVNEQAIFHVVMTFPLIALFAAGNRVVRWLSVAVVAASVLALVVTFSRGAWLAFPIGGAVCVALALRRRMIGRTAILTGAILTIGVAASLWFLAEPIYQRVAYGDTGATAARLRLLDLGWDLARAYPFIGVGPGEFDEAALKLYPPGFTKNQWVEPGQKLTSTTIGRVDYSELRLGNVYPYRRPLPVHNKYLLALSELGLPGLAIWLWLYAEFIRLAWRCSKLPDRVLRLLGIAGMGVTFAELVYMMVEHFSDIKPLEFVLFVPALIFAALSSQAAGVDHRPSGSAG